MAVIADGSEADIAIGRREIATGALVWKRAIRIPPLFGPGALEIGPFRAGRKEESAPAMESGRLVISTGAAVGNRAIRIPPKIAPGAIEPSRPGRPKETFRGGGRTEEPAPTMAIGSHVISTGDVVWKWAIRIPPIFGFGDLAI